MKSLIELRYYQDLLGFSSPFVKRGSGLEKGLGRVKHLSVLPAPAAIIRTLGRLLPSVSIPKLKVFISVIGIVSAGNLSEGHGQEGEERWVPLELGAQGRGAHIHSVHSVCSL